MEIADAVRLLKPAAPGLKGPGHWVDLGSGTGTFTLGLAELLPAGSTIEAVDVDASALSALPTEHSGIHITTRQRDISSLPLPWHGLRGVLVANALHFIANQRAVLAAVVTCLAPGGTLIVVEYDTDQADRRWVPYPVSRRRLEELGHAAGLGSVEMLGRRPSRYGGRTMYAAMLGAIGAPS